MSRSFDLNPSAAKEATNGGKRITEPGPYTGKCRAAWYEKNEKGTESVAFLFVADNGQEAGPLALYTHNNKGEELPSYKMLNAIMACLKVRKIETKKGRVMLWDRDQNAEVEKEKETYPALMDKPVGFVLQGEEYLNRDGDLKVRLVIAAPFEAATRKMATEVLSSAAEANDLDKYLAWFDNGHHVKPLKGAKRPVERTATEASHAVDEFSDEVPF